LPLRGPRPVPERWVPERILHGHLAGAGALAEVACSGDDPMLTGRGLPGRPLVCRGLCGTMLNEPLAQAACGLMAVHGRGRARSAARLGVD
jgi:hypothetical protein